KRIAAAIMRAIYSRAVPKIIFKIVPCARRDGPTFRQLVAECPLQQRLDIDRLFRFLHSVLRCEGLRELARVFLKPSQMFFILIPRCSLNFARVARVCGAHSMFSIGTFLIVRPVARLLYTRARKTLETLAKLSQASTA